MAAQECHPPVPLGTRYSVNRVYNSMPHPERSRAACGLDFERLNSIKQFCREARQQTFVVIGNLDRPTKAEIIAEFEKGIEEHRHQTCTAAFRHTTSIWMEAVRHMDKYLRQLINMALVDYLVPEGIDEPTEDGNEACVICMTHKKKLCLQCGHIVFCHRCANDYIDSKGPKKAACPLCNKPITMSMSVVYI
jgi:hypothetical protein